MTNLPRLQPAVRAVLADPEDRVLMTLGEVHGLPDETSGEPVFLRAGAADFTARLVEHGHPDAPVELRF